MSSARQTPESGLRFDRIGVVREAVTGEIPADPNWQYHSDNYLNFSWSPSPDASRRDGLGTPDAVDHDVGNEGHEVTVAYDLQRQLVDGSGNPDGFAGDAWLRDDYNQIYNTHALLARESRGPSPADPADVAGARTYTVMKGGYPNANFEGDPEEDSPIPMEISYTAEKVRSYEILQPASETAITVESENPDDVGLDVTIENEGAGTTETVTLTEETDADGNFVAANATTTATFADVDAVEAQSEPIGDLDVRIDGGSTLLTIHGALHYSNDDQPLEGDLGVPALGAGSHPTEIGTSYEHFLGDSIQRNSEGLAYDLNNMTAEVDNNYSTSSRSDSVRYRINEGNRSISVNADVIGERESHKYIMQSLTAQGDDINWTLSKTQFDFLSAAVTDPPERTRESDEAAASIGVGFEPEGDPAVQISQA